MKNSRFGIKNTGGRKSIGLLLICLCFAGLIATSCEAPGTRTENAKTDSIAGAGSSVAGATPVSARSALAPDTTSLKGDWFLQDIKGSPVSNLKTAFIRFDTAKSSFSGSTGCNTMKGVFWYSDNDTSLVFGDRFLTTKTACNSMDEHAFIRSLMNTNHYLLKNSQLILLSDDGKELSSWKRASGGPSGGQRTVKL